jgi:hypothetical protein
MPAAQPSALAWRFQRAELQRPREHWHPAGSRSQTITIAKRTALQMQARRLSVDTLQHHDDEAGKGIPLQVRS